MSDGMVFVLHAVADEKYATELAAALAPATAIAAALSGEGARGVQLGGGAASLLIWSSNTNAEAALAALPYAAAVCSVRGARVPEILRARALRVVDVSGDAASDVAQLRDVMSELQAFLRARSLDNSRRRGSVAPRLGAAPVDAQAGDSRKPLLVRSAVGLGATLAVVGVVAPAITNRALATNMTPENVAEPSVAQETMLPATSVQVQEAAVEDVADDPLMMLTTYNEPAAPIAAQRLNAYAPQSIAFVERYEAIAPLATLISADLPTPGEVRVAFAIDPKKPQVQVASLSVSAKDESVAELVAQSSAE